MRAYVARAARLGIRNACALLRRRARHGGARAGRLGRLSSTPRIDGQVNGVLAKRSPGSTLKPFVYALGLDQGVMHPRTMLRTRRPRSARSRPENFDGRFVGPDRRRRKR